MINKGSVEINGKLLPVLSVEVIPSDYSDTENLRFDWQTTEMTKRSIRFELLFETAKYVSANEEPDRIRITFNDRYMFVSESDLAI